jgi:hypothetical protein
MPDQLADVIIRPAQPTLVVAAELAARTLAELPGCVLVAMEVARRGVLLAARPGQRVLVQEGDVVTLAVAAYESLVRGDGILASRSPTAATFGSPLAR